MVPHMICLLSHQTSAGEVRRLRISVPLVPQLLDNERYFLPDALPAPAGEELRPMSSSKITRAPRAPSLKTLVKYALECDSAEELGKKLKRRFERQQQRRWLDADRSRVAAAVALSELDRIGQG